MVEISRFVIARLHKDTGQIIEVFNVNNYGLLFYKWFLWVKKLLKLNWLVKWPSKTFWILFTHVAYNIVHKFKYELHNKKFLIANLDGSSGCDTTEITFSFSCTTFCATVLCSSSSVFTFLIWLKESGIPPLLLAMTQLHTCDSVVVHIARNNA